MQHQDPQECGGVAIALFSNCGCSCMADTIHVVCTLSRAFDVRPRICDNINTFTCSVRPPTISVHLVGQPLSPSGSATRTPTRILNACSLLRASTDVTSDSHGPLGPSARIPSACICSAPASDPLPTHMHTRDSYRLPLSVLLPIRTFGMGVGKEGRSVKMVSMIDVKVPRPVSREGLGSAVWNLRPVVQLLIILKRSDPFTPFQNNLVPCLHLCHRAILGAYAQMKLGTWLWGAGRVGGA
ncbi:hypothetical protein V8B97DRAFT_943495 [Scleroderma yunnanense]